jgi:formate dehydrogenase major subunit
MSYETAKIRPEKIGMSVDAMAGETILAAARPAGTDIPAMCPDPRIRPTGERKLCHIVLAGQADHVNACVSVAEDGMKVEAEDPGLNALRRERLNTCFADHNADWPRLPTPPAGGGLSSYPGVGLKRPYDAAESCILTLQDVWQIHQDLKAPLAFRRRTNIEE